MREIADTVVIGAGHAGLAAARSLERRGVEVVLLEENERVGDQWRRRWDTLRLFTPARWDGVADTPFPGDPDALPTKDEIADFTETLPAAWGLTVRTGERVVRLSRENDRFAIESESARGPRRLLAQRVVIASGATRVPRIPPLASELAPSIQQLDGSTYHRPSDVPEGTVLVVGAGNSGAEIAIELARAGRETILAGRSVGRIPPVAYLFGGRPFWFFATRVTDVGLPLGRRIAARAIDHGTPIIGMDPREIDRAGVRRTPRVSAVREGWPVLENGEILEVATVVWCTGFRPDHGWIDLPIFDERGLPRLHRGLARDSFELAFIGLPFQFSLSSALIGGASRDAERIVPMLLDQPTGRRTEPVSRRAAAPPR